ncbi:MAG TPA: glycosyltransferase [Spongiibacteraceae bacterium]|nr:glycosyltransferase [Spongiibacteraceae bacterium]
MKILLLVQKSQRVLLDSLYEAIARHAESCDIRRLDDDQQANLARYFRENVDTSQYDRIVFFLRFKKEIKQRRFIKTVPNLVILEHDAWQNYAPGKYRGAYSKHYRALPWARIICSGYTICQNLCAEGFDAHFVSKGYDQTLLRNLQQPRPVELAFVGSIRNRLYAFREPFLRELATVENLQILKTQSGQEYLEKLNAIRFFVSADMGMGEYMIKNFEAMACGCVLIAYDQGKEENSALGFNDMKNVVLYKNVEDLRRKLGKLRDDPALSRLIAEAGQRLAEESFAFDKVGARIVDALRPPLRQHQVTKSRLLRLWQKITKMPYQS